MNFIIYDVEKGLINGQNQICVKPADLGKPWPMADSSLDSADIGDLFCTLGPNELFYHVVRELWRCLKPDAPISMAFPHPRHDLFLSNPEYTRPMMAETLEKFNAELNDKWKALGVNYPRLAHRFGVNFQIAKIQMNADPYWQDLLDRQQISNDDMELAAKQATNVVSTMQIRWGVRKEAIQQENKEKIPAEMLKQFKEQIAEHRKNGNEQAATLIEGLIEANL